MTHSPVFCPRVSTQAELWCSERRQSACRFSTVLHPAAPAQTRRKRKEKKTQWERRCVTAYDGKPSFLITAVSGVEEKKKIRIYFLLFIFHISGLNDCLMLKCDLSEVWNENGKMNKTGTYGIQ